MAEQDSAATPRLGRWAALGGSAVLTARLVVVVVTLVGTAAAFVLAFVGIGFYALPTLLRWHHAQLLGIATSHARLTGTRLPVPAFIDGPDPSGWREHVHWTWTALARRETWVLLRWASLDSLVGIVIAVMPLGLVAWGFEGLVVLPGLYLFFGILQSEWYTFIYTADAAVLPFCAIIGVFLIVLGVLTGPWWLRVHARWACWLLGGERGLLRERVDVLTASRAEARRDAASELRRIEREVHDGTQSQLVAIGLKLGTAELMMETEPDRARALIGQAKADSSAALAELRDLMRGIRPPVLADRGLAAALDALALDATTTVTTRTNIVRAHDPDIETVVYFGARELLANAIKHADARAVTIDADDHVGLLVVTVTDDGDGGATVVPGHGLDGTRLRLSLYDGTLTVTSPRGGPTSIRIEVPCGS